MMGKLSKNDAKLLSDCILAIVNGDYWQVEHILITLGSATDEINYMQLYNDIKILLNKNKNVDLSDINLKKFMSEFISMLSNNNITLQKRYYYAY